MPLARMCGAEAVRRLTPQEQVESTMTGRKRRAETASVSSETGRTARRAQTPPEAQTGEATAAPSDWPPTERISWFPIPDEDELDPRVAELVARQREKLGAPNNVVRVHAWRPELMLRWLELFDYISKGPSGLSRVEREMIGVVVSAENRCIF